MTIRIIITGGTIDDLEYKNIDQAPTNHSSYIPSSLKCARISLDYSVQDLMAKDSRFVTDDDRELIVKACKECNEDYIIITHGTMSLPITAKYLGKASIPKTIILVGAAIPVNKENSDALFNLGAAVTAVQLLPMGVYVTMNGKIFTWDNVKKNFKTGYFEEE